MKRRELEDRMQSASSGIGSAIDAAPRRAVVAAFILGIVAAVFPGIVFPLLIVTAAVLAAFWYVCDPELPTEYEVPAATSDVADPVEQKKRSAGRSESAAKTAKKPVNGSHPASAAD